jgi:lipopolysaccharide export system protein LptA
MPRLEPIAMLLLLLGVPGLAGAVNNDQPIELDADHWEAEGREGYSVFTGNVELRQGGLVMRGERMLVRAPEDVFEYAEVTGEPASFEQREPGRPPTRGRAGRIEYFAGEERLRLETAVRVEQPNQEFEAETVDYSLQQERVTAAGGIEGDGRVRMRMKPRQDNEGSR